MGNEPSMNQTGLRIIFIAASSPASQTDLQEYLDFIVEIMGTKKNFNLMTDFFKFVTENEENEIKLVIFNQLTKLKRIVLLKPSRNWTHADFFLGLKFRIENFATAQKNIYRISAVKNDSIQKQIEANSDFFLGIEQILFDDLNELRIKLGALKNCDIILFNMNTKTTRKIQVDCEKGLGLEFSVGYLHELSEIYQQSVFIQQTKLQKNKIEEVEVWINGEKKDISFIDQNFQSSKEFITPIGECQNKLIPNSANIDEENVNEDSRTEKSSADIEKN